MQLLKTFVIAAIATVVCFSSVTAADSVNAEKSTPNVRKLYYTKFPTPSPVAQRKLYYTKFPTPSPVVGVP
ncbi:hypothetical protein DVH05_004768 [Phytophthora capsici]|nr:hypothetical protein DVH05_004768 [Phytophthora capsici]